jgi:hypothetical protein
MGYKRGGRSGGSDGGVNRRKGLWGRRMEVCCCYPTCIIPAYLAIAYMVFVCLHFISTSHGFGGLFCVGDKRDRLKGGIRPVFPYCATPRPSRFGMRTILRLPFANAGHIGDYYACLKKKVHQAKENIFWGRVVPLYV